LKKLIILLAVLIMSHGLRAEIFGSAGTIRPGVMMFGIEPEVTVDPTDVMGYFHFGAGLFEKMDLNFKLGLGSASTYFGGDLQYLFVKSSVLDFALSLGASYQNAAFLDINPIFTHRFEGFDISTGPDLDWQLSRGTFLSVSWFVGTAFPIFKHVDAMFDVGVKIRGNNSWISGGIATYF
jgi:hypothetical protein